MVCYTNHVARFFLFSLTSVREGPILDQLSVQVCSLLIVNSYASLKAVSLCLFRIILLFLALNFIQDQELFLEALYFQYTTLFYLSNPSKVFNFAFELHLGWPRFSVSYLFSHYLNTIMNGNGRRQDLSLYIRSRQRAQPRSQPPLRQTDPQVQLQWS